jgi:hypothetical protein
MPRELKRDRVDDMYEFIDQYGAWARITFPLSDEASIIAHLRSEVTKELEPGCDITELADVFLLLAHLAYFRKLKRPARDNDLPGAIARKARINKERKWAQKPNKEGFFPHTEESPNG